MKNAHLNKETMTTECTQTFKYYVLQMLRLFLSLLSIVYLHGFPSHLNFKMCVGNNSRFASLKCIQMGRNESHLNHTQHK